MPEAERIHEPATSAPPLPVDLRALVPASSLAEDSHHRSFAPPRRLASLCPVEHQVVLQLPVASLSFLSLSLFPLSALSFSYSQEQGTP